MFQAQPWRPDRSYLVNHIKARRSCGWPPLASNQSLDLTDAQWAILRPLLEPRRRPDGRGRPRRDARTVLNGILWILRTGASWHDLPSRYPPYQTCHRRFQQWQRDGTLTHFLNRLAEDLRDCGKLDLSETFIDASFSAAKKGALLSARLATEKAVKSWRSQIAMVFLSPATSPALRRLKRNSSSHSPAALHPSATATADRRCSLRQRPPWIESCGAGTASA